MTMALAVGCKSKVVYSEFSNMPLAGWHQDSVLTFDVAIEDSIATYDIIAVVRHTYQYPYQNIWLYCNADTVGEMMAGVRGEWLGSGWGDHYERSIILEHDKRFAHSGVHTFALRHGMRREVLEGVKEVGLVVEKADHGKE